MRSWILIYVANIAHWPLVAHVLTCLEDGVHLHRTGARSAGILRGIVILIGVVSMRAVAIVNRRQAIHCSALSAVVLRLYRAVVVNDIVHSITPAIICIYLGQKIGPVICKLQVSAARLGHTGN